MTAPAIERIRVLCKELTNALDEWIETEMGGETWAIRIYPTSVRGSGVFLENISYCEDVMEARDTPKHRRLGSGGRA